MRPACVLDFLADYSVRRARIGRDLVPLEADSARRQSRATVAPTAFAARLLAIATVAALLLGGAGAARAQDVAAIRCNCAPNEGACQHFLRNPKKVTADPCYCVRCRDFSAHDGTTIPFGWNPACVGSKKEGLYLKRHSAAWGITCSDCVQDEKSCKFNAATCPDCDEEGTEGPLTQDYEGRDAKSTVLARLAKERRFFPKSKEVRVLYNRHFYVVSDIASIKVRSRKGSPRKASGHEWAHLMIERAMYAKREFTETFGDRIEITKPTGMWFPRRAKDAHAIQRENWGNPLANIIYGGTDQSTVAEGFCFHGFCLSQDEFGQAGDLTLHHAMRHMLGHELVSCWVLVDGYNRALPRWMHVGAAHWLSRSQERFRLEAVACNLEGEPLTLAGHEWDMQMYKLGRATEPGEIESLFAKSAQGQLTRDDHRRTWSFFHHGLSEWRKPFVAMLHALRRRTPVREAFMEHLKCTPEVFEERWRERVTGRRKSIGPASVVETKTERNDDPSARDRTALSTEKHAPKLAARIRGLGAVTDARTARVLVDLFARDSDLVRETVMVKLLETTDEEVLDAVWEHGLAHAKTRCRAYTARLCARMTLVNAAPALRVQLADPKWFARAEAAVALGTLRDAASLEPLRKMVHDPAAKARLAAMDALAMYGAAAEPAVATIAGHLSATRWQSRLVAAQALGEIGSMEGVEPLIDRMRVESGRVHDAIHTALTKLTLDDLGREHAQWSAWWERAKARASGGLPARPEPGELQTERPDENLRYGTQEYFGIELFTNRVGFIVDTSGSMNLRFTPDPRIVAAMGREFVGEDKITVCKEEVAYALRDLDTRSRFTLVSFGTDVRIWKQEPVPASSKNVRAATRHLRGLRADGETNYHGALQAMLGLSERYDEDPELANTPDTITFLTDGMPTRGDITQPPALLEWYTGLNRYARVRTHVIAFGSKGLEVDFLRAMAERNGGTFVWAQEDR